MAVLYPQEMMLKLQLFISIFYRSLPTSCSLSQSCQDVASTGLRLNGGIWRRSYTLARAWLCTKSLHFVNLHCQDTSSTLD